jgi:predicted ATP-dependent endonuclease of OLD family
MIDSNLPITCFAIGGYRSFGNKIQRFANLSKINLFIGQNNSGKSNILRFIHEIYPELASSNRRPLNLTPLDHHLPVSANFVTGTCISLYKNESGEYSIFEREISKKIPQNHYQPKHLNLILSIFQNKAELDATDENVWFDFDINKKLINDNWEVAFKKINDNSLCAIWNNLTNQTGGSRAGAWFPETLRHLTPDFKAVIVIMIPAIRQIGKHGSVSEEFSGEGIIERLAKLQNPDVLNQKDKDKFEQINKFLQNVIDNNSATIEIPYERNTIHVHINEKTLPLESLGTGIHEVIILAAAATILENTVICMEEPELHLNPILQKKLVRYLVNSTSNQYFITTHSAALMDTPGAEIYHIRLEKGQSIAERVTSDKKRSEICEDLGYHPSDLLQTNCVIWVEGPSDRIYINNWIKCLASDLFEGIHYSIMFYGGRLASHLSGEDIDQSIDKFISLRRLNRRGVIVIDSDKSSKAANLNQTKKRLMGEFNQGPGYAWITKGREIENYLSEGKLKEAISKIHPLAKFKSSLGQYENTLSITTKSGKEVQADKVAVANYIIENFETDLSQLDLKEQIQKLIKFVRESNPSSGANSNWLQC